MKFAHVVFFAFVFVMACADSVPFFLLRDVCLTNHCKRLGLEVHNSLDASVNPCANFYDFACGGWISKNRKPPSEITWNHFRAAANRVSGRLRAILEGPAGGASSLRKAQVAYKACVIERNHLVSLRHLIDSAFGAWSSSTAKFSNETTEQRDWLIEVVKATRITGSYPIVKMHVGIDLQDTSRHVLYIDPGQPNLPRPILVRPTAHADTLLKYKGWISRTVKYLYPELRVAELDGAVRRIIELEIQLAKLGALQKGRRKLSLKQATLTTGINWKGVTDALFADTHVDLTDEDFIVCSPSHLLQLVLLLRKKFAGNYIKWTVIRNLSRDTSRYMRRLNFEMDEAVFGAQSDLPRPQECVSKANEHFGPPLIAEYARKYSSGAVIRRAKTMAENIKAEYVEMLRENTWLSPATREAVQEKILAVEFLVGFPNWMANDTPVDQSNCEFVDFPNWMANDTLADQSNCEFVVSDNHFLNVVNSKRSTVKKELRKLLEPTSKRWWPVNPLEPNGFYHVLQNSIIIPLSLLEPPFFDVNRPAVFNYGALGSLMGHEMSHALDTTGRRADKNGNVRRWWAEEDIGAYELKAGCFARGRGVDGSHTIGENIADDVGVLLSHRAFKKHESRGTILPHLDSYNEEQLFFVAYSQLWCEIPDVGYNVLQEEHAPVQVRVIGTLNNSKEFRESFGCLSNKFDGYCELW